MVEDCTLHTMQGATARQLGFAWHAAMLWICDLWDDEQARYRSASRVLMNQLQRHATSRRGSVHQHFLLWHGGNDQDLLLDDGMEAVSAAKNLMKKM